jgi:tetratricopeptide (TPR) repeat protein
METQSASTLTSAYALIGEGNLREAQAMLEEALTGDLDNHDLVFAASCCSFWRDTIERLPELDSFEQGESLINHWRRFKLRVEREESPLEQTVYTFRKKVFSTALEQYGKNLDNADNLFHAEICRKIGFCYKQLGDFVTALAYLQEAYSTVEGRADIIAEMADCYDLCGEDKPAKVLFREAFFLDPQKVDLSFLESPLIGKLIALVTEKGLSGVELLEWIPVYGTIFGVFNVKRKLKSQEIGRLKQDIYAKENEMKNPNNDLALIKPRLLNMYFWLVDYCELAQENNAKIQEALLKIKLLDKNIYMLYTGNI